MPLYSYHCDSCGWEKDHLCSYSTRPDVIDCGGCGNAASHRITAAKHQNYDAKFYTGTYSREKRGLSLHEFKCNACDHIFEEIVDHGAGESPSDNFECPECNVVDSQWRPSAKIDRWSERFPYYDRGLGVMLQSKAHRRQICKERGLTPVDGDFDEEKVFSQFDKRRERDEKEYNDYVDRLDNAPEFKEFRQAQDQGRF